MPRSRTLDSVLETVEETKRVSLLTKTHNLNCVFGLHASNACKKEANGGR